jgi:serine/threonine protein kinase
MEAEAKRGTFGAYEIVRRLGVGGMAETSLAIRRGPGGFEQRVCLKRVLPAYSEDSRFVEMFLAEARIAARMRHNNVVQVFDFGVNEGSYFMALELVEGLDLRVVLERLKRRGTKLEIDLLVFLVYELLAALQYAHGLTIDGAPVGLVHRDVTPSNVLLSSHGEVKLADFGIAKATESGRGTHTGSVKGKIPYMAPEQAEGQRLDQRTDLFALGVVIYEMLAGRRPFDGPTDTATLMNISRGDYTPIAIVAPDAPPTLHAIVDKLLAHDREARLQTACDVSDAIVDLVPPPTTRRTLGRLIRDLEEPDRLAVADVGPRVQAAAPPRAEPPDGTSSGVRASGTTPAPDVLAAEHVAPDDDAVPNADVIRPHGLLNESDVVATLPLPGVAPMPSAPATSEPRPTRTRWLIVGAIVAMTAALAVGLAALALPEQASPSSREESAGPDAPASEQRVNVPDGGRTAQPTLADAGTADAGAADAGTADAGTAEEEALLRVRAVPWGKIWIDQRFVGRDTVSRRLRPGPHTIGVGPEAPTNTTRVVLRPGQTRVLNLSTQP